MGHFAVQIAKHLGARVLATSSSKNKEFVRGLRVDEHIDYPCYDWKNFQEEYDFVLDTIGGDNTDRLMNAVNKGGTVFSIPTSISDPIAEKAEATGVDAYLILVQSNGDNIKQIASLLENGTIRSYIFNTFDFSEIAAAIYCLQRSLG